MFELLQPIDETIQTAIQSEEFISSCTGLQTFLPQHWQVAFSQLYALFFSSLRNRKSAKKELHPFPERIRMQPELLYLEET